MKCTDRIRVQPPVPEGQIFVASLSTHPEVGKNFLDLSDLFHDSEGVCFVLKGREGL